MPLLTTGAGRFPAAVGGGDAAETTAFLARADAITTVGATERAAYKALINGLVSDSDFASLDVLYIFATDTQAHALLNLISTSYNAADFGSGLTLTFTADAGVSSPNGDHLTTGFIPSSAGGNYSQNSASIGYYNLTSGTAADSSVAIGIDNQSWIIQNQTGGPKYYDVNDANFPAIADGQHQGLWITTRTAASGAGAVSIYKNGNTTPAGTDTGASSAVPTVEFFILTSNNAGTASRATSDQISAALIGGGLTSAAIGRISARINAYMTALGINVY